MQQEPASSAVVSRHTFEARRDAQMLLLQAQHRLGRALLLQHLIGKWAAASCLAPDRLQASSATLLFSL